MTAWRVSERMTTALGYVRVSDDDQGKYGKSLPVQRQRIEEYCRQKGWQLLHIYEDVQSGRRDDRQQYQAMLARIRKGDVSAVVVQWLDRFGRNTEEMLPRIWEMRRLKVDVVATDQDVSDPFILNILAAVAEFESRRIGERVRVVMARLHEQGKRVQPPPYGYCMSDDGYLLVVPEEAVVVRQIFRWFLNGVGIQGIVVRLNNQGIPAPRGGKWWPRTLELMLRTPSYIGHTLRNGILVEHTHEPIIDAETWQAVQELLRRRAWTLVPRAPNTPFPLAGLLRCAHCGRRLYTAYQRYRTKRKPHRSYRCPGHKNGTCRMWGIAANSVEHWLLEQAAAWRFDDARDEAKPTDNTDVIASLERELARTRERQRRAYDGWVDGLVDEATYRQKAAELRGAIERIQNQLDTARRATQTAANADHIRYRVEHFVEWWCDPDTTDRERRLLLGDFLEAIEVAGPGQFQLVWRPEYRGRFV